MISIDLLLKKIAFSEFAQFDFDIIEYFSMQINCFLDNDLLISKIKAMLDYFVSESRDKTKILPDKKFPIGIIKLLNNWIKNEYTEKLSKEHFIKINEIYSNFSKIYITELSSMNKFILKIENVKKYLEVKIHHSPEYYNKFNRPIAIYLQNRQLLVSNGKKEEPILPSKHTLYFDILQWSEIEIARQLSLISNFLFCKIRISELFLSRWTKGEKFTNSPHIMKCIDRFNKLSLWITEEVLSYDRSSLRALVLEKFILVANECLKMNNFNDCFLIITALNSFMIKRLNKSWKKIKSFEVMKIYFNLMKLCSFKNNLSLLRLETKKVLNKPCVPYLGIYLNLLAFLEEGPKYFKDNLINLDKIKKFGLIYTEFSRNDKYIYDYKPVFMLSFLAEPSPSTENELIELSQLIEPKFKLSHSKLNIKRISITDIKSMEMTKTFHKIMIESIKITDSKLNTLSTKMNLKESIKKFFEKK